MMKQLLVSPLMSAGAMINFILHFLYNNSSTLALQNALTVHLVLTVKLKYIFIYGNKNQCQCNLDKFVLDGSNLLTL